MTDRNKKSDPQPTVPPIPVPAGAAPWITPKLLRDAIDVYSSKYKTQITADEAVGILHRMGAVIDIVRE